MNIKVEVFVREKATEFVGTLDGRYKTHVSDQFMVAFILYHFTLYWIPIANQSIQHLAYQSCVNLFESLLEYGCKAGGNGHHVAQKFSSLFPDIRYDELKNDISK